LSHEVQVSFDGRVRQEASGADSQAITLQVTLADQQQDPNSPLFSAKSFDDLNL